MMRVLDSALIRRNGQANINLDNKFFIDLLKTPLEKWKVNGGPPATPNNMWKNEEDNNMLMYSVDLFFRIDPELLTITQEFAADNDQFLLELKYAWTKLANMDRYFNMGHWMMKRVFYRCHTYFIPSPNS